MAGDYFSDLELQAAPVTYDEEDGTASRGGLKVNRNTVEAFEALEEALLTSAVGTEKRHVRSLDVEPGGDLIGSSAVVGVAIGDYDPDGAGLHPPGEACLHLYTTEPMSAPEARAHAAAVYGIRALDAEDVAVVPIHTGPIDLLAHRFHLRPAPGGISAGHVKITAGTLGCLVKGRSGERASLTLALSNNHVFADVNRGKAGDSIVQPGTHDGGQHPKHQIGVLERYVRIGFGNTSNLVDAATAIVDPSLVRPELMYLKGGQPMFFTVGKQPLAAKASMLVGKTGRTTQLTSGRITATGATIQVNMGGGRIAVFRDQIAIQGTRGDFSRGGDSGSLVWTWDKRKRPVGLLFAGGGGLTFANPIDHVLKALDVELL